LELDFPFKTVYSNPITGHCKGHVSSNFRRVALGRHLPQKKEILQIG